VSHSIVVYLHDYFTQITPGPATLRVSVTVWGEGEESLDLHGACHVVILPADDARLASRISEIAKRLGSHEPAEQRLELLRSVAALDHLDLIQLFLDALRDPVLMLFHTTARRRATQLGERYGREAVLRHLHDGGGRYDGIVFDTWTEMGVQLSDAETAALAAAASPWIRLFSLETFRNQALRRGAIESLRTEAAELDARAERLEP
jgi:hypothetical protein